MLSAFWVNWVGILFDTAPYVVLWLLLESVLHSRLAAYTMLPTKLKLWLGVRHTFGDVWRGNWYWQLVGVTMLAALALVLPENINQWLELAYDAQYRPDWVDVASVSFLGILTLASLLQRAFPNSRGGCGNGNCSVEERH